MRQIFFYSDYLSVNYLNDTDFYSYMNYDEIFDPKLKKKIDGFSFTGKYVHSNYLYWLAKNNGFNILHTTDVKKIPTGSVLLFHCDFYNSFEFRDDIINVQILSDKALIPFADYYLTNNKLFAESKKFNNVLYLPEPIPARNLNSKHESVSVPLNFRFLGIRNNFPEFFTDELCDKLRKDNINIIKDFTKNYLESNDHVFFFLRNENGKALKHSNRIFLTYLTEIPYVGNITEDDKQFLISNEDVINASNKDQLIQTFYDLKKEENYLNIKARLKNADKNFYKNHFLNEFKNIINYFEKL